MRTFLTILLLGASAAFAQSAAKPLVIAHRGASGYLPEHTIAAKAYAHALGADYIEQDLVLSKDDVPIVMHDIYVDTVTDVAKRFPDRKRADGRYYVLDFTVAELKQLRVTERFNAKTGERVFPEALSRPPIVLSALNLRGRTAVDPGTESQHRSRGRDLSGDQAAEMASRAGARYQPRVLPILASYGYAKKSDPCFLQCFELAEVRRLRKELGWRGQLVMLIESKSKGDDGTDHDFLCTAAGMKEIAKVADGIGPAIGRMVTWPAAGGAPKFTELVKFARAAKLSIHPYTVRIDDLPKNCPSSDALHAVFSRSRESKACSPISRT